MNPRALVAGSARVAWRRSVTDRGLLLGVLALVVVTAFLGLTGPRLVATAADEAARAAVRDAGSRADVVATLGWSVGGGAEMSRDEAAVTKIQNAAGVLTDSLPREVRAVTGDPSAALVSGRVTLRSAQSAEGGAVARFVWLWRAGTVGVTWVEGAAPQASPAPVEEAPETADGGAPPVHLVEVGLTRAGADAVGAQVGDHLTIIGPTRGLAHVVVSGIYRPVDAADPLWTTVPGLLGPTAVGQAGASIPSLGLLLSDASLPDVDLALQRGAITTQYRFPADADSLVSDDVEPVRARVSALVANPAVLTLAGGSTPTVATEIDSVLGDHQAHLRGARAQASVLLVGLVAVGALTLLLAARLVVGRRQVLLAAERARGASVASVALRLALESVPLAVVGVGLGVLGSWLVDRTAPWTWWPGIAVALVAVLAVPVGGARVASTSWTGQRTPANRKDRDRLRGRRRARRTVVELSVVILALAATSAARGRGLQQTQTQDVDLLLAATPVLLAGAGCVVVLRAFPAVLRLLARAAASRRGLVPLVATARATRTGSLGLPLLTLTVALGLLVFSGVTAASTQRGEERAAIEVVGADVRLDGVVAPDILATLRAADGVTALASGTQVTGRTFNGDPAFKATLLAVDAAAYGTIAAAHDPRYAGELAHLDDPAGSDTRPRAVVSEALADEVAARGATVFVGGATIELDVVGTTDLGRPGEAFVIVDLAALAPFTVDPVEPDRTWVDGRGAAVAVAAAGDDLALTGVTVTDRAVWLAHLRDSPLVRSVVALLTVAALVLALYAAVALLLTVVATSTERGRTLSSLRTLGLDRGATWRITLGELAPLTTAGILTGAAIGLGVPLILTGALGLNQLTGEAGDTAVAITAGPFLLAVGASLLALVISVVVEAAVRRSENLGEVLRVGDR
ncbi:FtsX-like permease family protein [Pengzhenrongella frigida]|uniref:ABC transporter permease n=1 Tax=Pengzhenrongella frigida TaxID=1259133 RepID=A0A4Q5N3U5_9MICO|nr:FtsX-like permease family protein [Cellulomonas sp. HLT2-17]RYV51943.1 ABC transporter permease [Cellulomonas sp. HLT2-17]